MEIAFIVFGLFVIALVFALISDSEKQKGIINAYSENPKQEIENNNSIWGEISDELPANKEATYALLSKIEHLKKINITFEETEDPFILESLKAEMDSLIRDCIIHKELYPYSFCQLKDAGNILIRVKVRYNERLYLIVKKSLVRYKLKMSEPLSEADRDLIKEILFSQIQEFQSYLDKTASNYDECFVFFTELHNEVDDLFSKLIYNDLDLPESFNILLEKTTFNDYITAIATLISNNELSKENLDKILNEYHINNIMDIKLDLLDLLLSYICFVFDSHIITEKERRNVGMLKLYFKIKEGDFYKYRYDEVKIICEQHFLRLYRDNNIDYSEELFMVQMQSIFDLSYSQMDKFKTEEIKRALKEGANIMNLNTDKLIDIK